MRYYIEKKDGYILGVGTGLSGEEITEAEYAEIISLIINKPEQEGTTDYRLKEDFTWEEYEVEPTEEEPTEEDMAEAGRVMLAYERDR